MKLLTAVRIGFKLLWVNDGERFIKLNSTNLVPQASDEGQSTYNIGVAPSTGLI